MSKDYHSETDTMFEKWIKEASSNDTKVMLRALHWLCIRTEENGYGVQLHADEIKQSLTEIIDKLDKLPL